VPPAADSKEMFVQYVMTPLVQQYRKVFTEDIQYDTLKQREAHTKVKQMMLKLVPLEKAILSMVITNLPSPKQS